MNCQARLGLLVLRECGAPAAGFCGSCGKAVCADHQVGTFCPACAALESGHVDNPAVQDAAARQSYYEEYGEPELGAGNYFSRDDDAALARGMIAGLGLPRHRPDYDPTET